MNERNDTWTPERMRQIYEQVKNWGRWGDVGGRQYCITFAESKRFVAGKKLVAKKSPTAFCPGCLTTSLLWTPRAPNLHAILPAAFST